MDAHLDRCWCVLALAGASACVANPPPSGPPPSGPPPAMAASGCDLVTHAFEQTSPGPCGKSVWKFAAHGDGSFDATETGCAAATGTARYDGATVVLDFKYGGGAGRYQWPLDGNCQGAPGQVSWSEGGLKGQAVASTLAVAPNT